MAAASRGKRPSPRPSGRCIFYNGARTIIACFIPRARADVIIRRFLRRYSFLRCNNHELTTLFHSQARERALLPPLGGNATLHGAAPILFRFHQFTRGGGLSRNACGNSFRFSRWGRGMYEGCNRVDQRSRLARSLNFRFPSFLFLSLLVRVTSARFDGVRLGGRDAVKCRSARARAVSFFAASIRLIRGKDIANGYRCPRATVLLQHGLSPGRASKKGGRCERGCDKLD